MSFILDALKKSESERQRQSVPGLLDVPMPAPKQRFPIWGMLLGLLLGVNLVVLLVVLVRSESHRSPATPAAQNAVSAAAPSPAAAANAMAAGAAPNYAPGAVANAPAGSMAANAAGAVAGYGAPVNAPPYGAAPGYGAAQNNGAPPGYGVPQGNGGTPAYGAAPTYGNAQGTAPAYGTAPPYGAAPAYGAATANGVAPASGAAPANAAPFSPMDAPVYAPEIPVPQGSAAQGTGYAAAPSSAQARPPAQEPTLRSARTALPPQAQIPPEPDEIVPTLQELNLTGNHSIPELHLDIHVYANRPADRFVFINNRKYKEGSTLQEGPTVERITRDGVLLRYRNLRFSIPRQ